MSYKTNYSVYKITNVLTNKYYIGIDSYFPKRLKQHQSLLSNNKHKNKYLQNSYNKYGIDNFKFELLLNCNSREEMLSKEVELIKEYNSLENGYNHTIGGEGSFGYKHSEESISKMSSWKREITQEWKNNISKGTKGKKKAVGIKRINHPDYSKWLGGEKHPVAKFKKYEIDNIRLLFNKGKSLQYISKLYNTSKTYISSIINNRFWKDDNYNKLKSRYSIFCIEDNKEFDNIKEVCFYYNISESSVYNNMKNLSKIIRTHYGNKTFKKI